MKVIFNVLITLLMPVGEKQLIMGCSESDKDKNKQLENRYSYVFVIK